MSVPTSLFVWCLVTKWAVKMVYREGNKRWREIDFWNWTEGRDIFEASLIYIHFFIRLEHQGQCSSKYNYVHSWLPDWKRLWNFDLDNLFVVEINGCWNKWRFKKKVVKNTWLCQLTIQSNSDTINLRLSLGSVEKLGWNKHASSRQSHFYSISF